MHPLSVAGLGITTRQAYHILSKMAKYVCFIEYAQKEPAEDSPVSKERRF